MISDVQNYHIAEVRKLLSTSLDDPGLDAFCMDHFPEVYDKFGRGMRKDEKITLLLDHCRRSPNRLKKLLDAVSNTGLASRPLFSSGCIALNKQGQPCSSRNLEQGDQLCREHLKMVLEGKEVKDHTGNLISLVVAKRQKRIEQRRRIWRLLFGWYSTGLGLSRAQVILGALGILVVIIFGLASLPSLQGLFFKEPTTASTPTSTPPLSSTPTALAALPAAPGEIVIVIAKFHGTEGYQIQERISRAIKDELEVTEIDNVRIIDNVQEAISPDQEDVEQAVQKLGDVYNATAVIWGWMDKAGFIPNFTITRNPFLFSFKPDLEEIATLPEEDFQIYIQENLPAQMAYFMASIVAQIYFWGGQIDHASRMLDLALIEARRGNTTIGLEHIYFYRGIIEWESRKNFEQAIVEYSQGININPNLGVLYTNRGIAYADLGFNLKAVEDYTKAIDKDDPAYAYNNRCIIYMNLKDLDRALDDCNQAIALQMGTTDVTNPFVNRGWVYWELDDFESALADFKAAISHDPLNVEAYHSIGLIYGYSNNPEQALSWYEQTITVDSNYSDAYHERGKIYEKQSDNQAALQNYEQAISVNPKNVYAYRARGDLYKKLGRDDEALADYLQVLLLEKNDYDLFDLCQHLNRCDEIVNQLQDLGVQSEDPRPAHVALGHFYNRLEEFEKAVREFSIALDLKATPAVYVSRAAAYLELADVQAAVDDYTEAIKLNAGDENAYEDRAQAYKKLERFDEALADYLQVARLVPRENYKYGQLGELCKELDMCEKILTDLAAETTKPPFDSNIYLILAQLNQELDNDEEAIESYTDFLEIDQDDTWAREKRADLLAKVDRLDEAVTDYTLILQYKPQAADIFNSRAGVYERQEEYQLALADYNEAIEIDPANDDTLSLRAALYEKLGDENLGTSDHVKIVSTEDSISTFDVDALIEYCQKYSTCDQAVDELSAIIDKETISKASIYYTRGRLYEEANQSSQALTDYSKATEIDPENDDILSARAALYDKLGDVSLSTKDRVRIISTWDSIWRSDVNTFIDYCQKHNTCYQAINEFSAIISKATSPRVSAYYARGRLHEETNQLDEALADYNEAIVLIDDEGELFAARARIHEQLSNYSQVVADYSKMLEISPELAQEAYLGRATTHQKLGHMNEALEDYVFAILVGAYSEKLMDNIIRHCSKLDSCDEVLTDLKKDAEKNSKVKSTQIAIGTLSYQVGDYEAAWTAFTSAIELDGGKDAYAGRAKVYVSMSQHPLATRDYVQALSTESIYSPLAEDLIQMCQAGNTCQEAINLLSNWIVPEADKDTILKSYYFQSLIHGALGNFEQESSTYVNLLMGDTTNSWYTGKLIERCQEMESCQLTLSQLNEAVASNTEEHTMLYYSRGRLLSELGNYKAAIDDFSSIIERNSTFALAYPPRAEAFEKLQMPKEAIADYVQETLYTSGSSFTSSRIINLCKEFDLCKYAEQVLDNAIATSPENGWLHYIRGYLYLEQGNISSSVDDFTQAIEIDSSVSTWFEARAKAFEQWGQNAAALEDYLQIVSLSSSSSFARSNLVHFCQKTSLCEEVVTKLTKVIEAQPGNLQFIVARAEVSRSLNDNKAALKDYNHAVTLAPLDSEVYKLRAQVRETLEDFTGALADYLKTVSFNKTDTSTAEDIIRVCLNLDECASVTKQLNDMLETDETNASLLLTRGRIFETLGDDTNAMADFTDVIALNTSVSYTARLRRVALYERQNNFEKTVEDYTILIEEHNHSEAYYQRGLAYKQLGKTDLAVQDLQIYLKINPLTSKRNEVEAEIMKLTQ